MGKGMTLGLISIESLISLSISSSEAPHRMAGYQINFCLGKQTWSELSVRGEPETVARSTKMMSQRAYKAYYARSMLKPVISGRTRSPYFYRFERGNS